jgi:hypothetical protein
MGSQCHIDSGMKDMLYTKLLGLVVTPSIRTYSPYISKKTICPTANGIKFQVNMEHGPWLMEQAERISLKFEAGI